MHLRLLPEKGKYKFRGVKMEMLVTKFSKGKYRNEGELFAEPISNENVKLMGEMIALYLHYPMHGMRRFRRGSHALGRTFGG